MPSAELLLFEPPPQAQRVIAKSGTKLQRRRGDDFADASRHAIRQPRAANAQSHVIGVKCIGSRPEWAVVVTETLIFEAVAAVNGVLAGTLQVAPAGAPVQVNVAVPATAWPPIERE